MLGQLCNGIGVAGMVVIAGPCSSIVMLAIVTGVWLVIMGIAQIVWACGRAKGPIR